MADAILAGELQHARLVRLVHAHDAARKGHAQPVLFAVLKGQEDIGVLVAQGVNGAAVETGITPEFIVFLYGHVGAAEQAYLFRLIFTNRRPPLQGIKMVLGKGFLLHHRRCARGKVRHHDEFFLSAFRLHDVHIARDQFQLGVVIGSAGLVGQRHPAFDIERGFLAVQGQDIIGTPVHALGQVGGFHLVIGTFIGQQPHQRGFGDQFFGKFGQYHHPGVPEIDLALNLIDRPVVDAEQCRRLFIEVKIGVFVHQQHIAAYILFHQLFRAHEIKFIVLLEDF
ncbi:MAG: hypothetical protein BWY09_02965 [Candidatus Hydrogenedentes bacterium ADurb.Bin179]|nr:MAG: hypothetical protein BWY09_02965 [Candidatus Hydrogenedentes bacterium ADurb.Bin179]